MVNLGLARVLFERVLLFKMCRFRLPSERVVLKLTRERVTRTPVLLYFVRERV